VERVDAAKDETKIWLPVPKKPASLMDAFFGAPAAPAAGAPGADGAPPAPAWKATTMHAHERELAAAKASGALMAALQPLLMAQFLGIHIMLLARVVLLPWECAEDPLLRRHVLGARDVRPYGEEYSDPEPAAAPAAVADAPGAGAGAGGGAGAGAGGAPAKARARDVEAEEAIFRTWESTDPAEMGIFEALAAGGRLNYATLDQGWTALHVVCGSRQNGRREVARLLELGAAPAAADRDGWNAAHWAAFHGVATAVAALAAAHGVAAPAPGGARAGAGGAPAPARVGTPAALLALLAARSAAGETPADLARAGGRECADAAAALDAAAAAAAAAAPSPLDVLPDGTPRVFPKAPLRAAARHAGDGDPE